ncbi:MAG: hypothetical protein AAFX94_24800, partial [Myxococcota bacterium]
MGWRGLLALLVLLSSSPVSAGSLDEIRAMVRSGDLADALARVSALLVEAETAGETQRLADTLRL